MLNDLTLEEVSLTFQVLVGLLPKQRLPSHLKQLDPSDWEMLGHLLDNLMCVRDRSTVH